MSSARDRERDIEQSLPEPPLRPQGFNTEFKFSRFFEELKETSLFWLPILLFGLLILISQVNNDLPLGRILVQLGHLRAWLEDLINSPYAWLFKFAMAAMFSLFAVRALKLKRQIDITPTSRIRSLAMGMVEIQGRARRMYDLRSPLTGTPCVYYRLRKYRNGFLQYELDSSHVPFCIEDESGRVAIDPASARIVPSLRRYGIGSEQGELTWTEDSRGLGKDYYIEDVLFDTVHLFVLGYAAPYRPQASPGLVQRTGEALFRLKRNPAELMKYDRDGDGNISLEEWDEARRQTEQDAIYQMLSDQAPTARQENSAMIVNPGKFWLPFIIAENQEELEVSARFRLAMVFATSMAIICFAWAVRDALSRWGS